MKLETRCPSCRAKLMIEFDLSEGPPDEVGTECDCGAIPVWRLESWYEFELGEYLHDERIKNFRA